MTDEAAISTAQAMANVMMEKPALFMRQPKAAVTFLRGAFPEASDDEFVEAARLAAPMLTDAFAEQVYAVLNDPARA